MALFKWDNIYSVGDPGIDAQHKRLFDIANRFYDAHSGHADRGTLMRIFNELIDYTATHFKDEEEFMRRHHYPDLPRHHEQHDKLVKLVLNYKVRLERAEPDADQNAMDFIRLWLNGHILGSDRLIGEHAGVR
jgi:hemerythrin